MIDSLYLLTWAGPFALLAIFLIVFAESGLFFGFFLPGDSLLFTAGLLASSGLIGYVTLSLVAFTASVLGDNVGYWFGHKVGPKIFAREDSKFFKKHHLIAAQEFYEKHGSKTIVLARFAPFVRTFAPIVAGAANMPYKTFMTYNLLGGLLWGVGLTSLGYFLGNIPFVKTHYELIIILIVVASIIPVALHFVKDLRRK
ncbi:VTT domain-containing protein [Candidatus Amesbacteria bacterium]|nr:VTT domain-containing protein [Candidatus Amesbacteria bacterium]